MIARYKDKTYRNISDAPPKYLLPPKPPRFRITVSGRYNRWIARLTEPTRERGHQQVKLEGQGVTPSDALYDLEHAIREYRWGWPEGWGRRAEAIGLVNYEIAMERAMVDRCWIDGRQPMGRQRQSADGERAVRGR